MGARNGDRTTTWHGDRRDLCNRWRHARVVNGKRRRTGRRLRAYTHADGTCGGPHWHHRHQLRRRGRNDGGRDTIEAHRVVGWTAVEPLPQDGNLRTGRTMRGHEGKDGRLPRWHRAHLHEVAHCVVAVLGARVVVLGNSNDMPIGVVHVIGGLRTGEARPQTCAQ